MQVENLAPFLMEVVGTVCQGASPEVLPFIIPAFPLSKCHLQIRTDESCSGGSMGSGGLCPLLSELMRMHPGCFLYGVFRETFVVWAEVYLLQEGHV